MNEMVKRQVEIEDNLEEIIQSVKDDIKDLAIEYLNDNPDLDEAPDIGDLDYSGSVHDIIDSSVPIYTGEINDLWYLYGNDFEEAFDNAGIGDKDDDHWPAGWKAAAIYCYIEQEIYSWYEDEKEEIFDAWKKDHPDHEEEEGS